MPTRSDGKRVLWPHYFDRSLSRAQGRRVKQELAVDHPKAPQIAQACRTLGLQAELLEDAKPPRFWADRKGCVVVAKTKDSKESVLNQVARRL